MTGSDLAAPIRRLSLCLSATILTFLASAATPVEAAEMKTLQALWQESITAEIGGDFERAASLTEDYRLQGGDSYLAALRCGWLCYLQGEFGKAISYYKIAKSTSPKAIAPLLGLANSHLGRGDSTSAIRACEAALRIDPNHYAANMMLGQCHYHASNFARATTRFELLHELYRDDVAAASWLAWSLFSLGEKKEAATLFRHILILSPDHPRAEEGLRLSRNLAE